MNSKWTGTLIYMNLNLETKVIWMQLVKRSYCFRDNRPQHKRTQSFRRLTVENRARIMKAHKLGFSVANLGDCFEVK